MYLLRSNRHLRRLAFLLALGLAVWVGGLAPLEGWACSHEASAHGVVHASQWCVWSCATGEVGVVNAAQAAIDRLPEIGRGDADGGLRWSAVQFAAVLSRGPPLSM